MEKLLKGYVFRMYPTKQQQILIEKSFGTSRYIYNYFLDKHQGKKYINAFNCIKELPALSEHNPWLKEVDCCLLRTSIFNLEDSFKRYSNKLSGYPKFKRKNKSRKSYQINTYYPSSQKCNHCGYKESKVKDLNIRNWVCPNCTNLNERDINASINILWEGIKLYMKKVAELQSF